MDQFSETDSNTWPFPLAPPILPGPPHAPRAELSGALAELQ